MIDYPDKEIQEELEGFLRADSKMTDYSPEKLAERRVPLLSMDHLNALRYDAERRGRDVPKFNPNDNEDMRRAFKENALAEWARLISERRGEQ